MGVRRFRALVSWLPEGSAVFQAVTDRDEPETLPAGVTPIRRALNPAANLAFARKHGGKVVIG